MIATGQLAKRRIEVSGRSMTCVERGSGDPIVLAC